MAINYTQLTTEINTDPRSLGYAGKQDGDIAVLLNTIGGSAETIFKAYTATEEIIAGIIRSEYDALTAANKSYLIDVILKTARVKTGDATIRSQVGAIFGAGTTTRTNLTNTASRSASRAEVLFGEDTTVTPADVARALRGV